MAAVERHLRLCCWILILISCCCCLVTSQPYQPTNLMFNDAMRRFVGYKNVGDVDQSTEIPTYMRELYFRYRNSDVPVGTEYANTVRSINAEIGIVGAESMFIFNLSSVESSESLVHSDIHIFKKRKRQGLQISVTLYELAPHYVTQLGSRDIPQADTGWFTFSVRDAVNSCLSVHRKLPHILALTFSKMNARGKKRPLHLGGFMRQMTSPFLVLYTNSSLNLTHDHVTARIPTASHLPNTFYNPENGQLERFQSRRVKTQSADEGKAALNDQHAGDFLNTPYLNLKHNHPNRDGDDSMDRSRSAQVPSTSAVPTSQVPTTEQDPTPNKNTYPNPNNNYKSKTSLKSAKQDELNRKMMLDKKQNSIRERFVRSVDNNHLPQRSVLSNSYSNARAQSNQNTYSSYTNSELEDYVDEMPALTVDVFSDDYVQSQYLPKLASDNRRNSQKQRRRKLANIAERNSRISNNLEQNEIPYPDEWDTKYNTYFNRNRNRADINTIVSPQYSQGCSVQRSALNFADIGWSEWIIEPKSFQTNFCAGSCSVPTPLSNGLSNHGSLKSLLQTVGQGSDIPAPCCVPRHMTSQTLLYRDQNNNIVLKNYRDMAVTSCECI